VKLLLDENLSPRLSVLLSDIFPESEHVHQCNLGNASDVAIWEYAKIHGFAIVSKDSDFFERSVLHGIPPKIIWVRVGNCSTTEIAELLRIGFQTIHAFIENDTETCLLLHRK
jgi:predicted nuclease of predicted toxin-antitoxin system